MSFNLIPFQVIRTVQMQLWDKKPVSGISVLKTKSNKKPGLIFMFPILVFTSIKTYIYLNKKITDQILLTKNIQIRGMYRGKYSAISLPKIQYLVTSKEKKKDLTFCCRPYYVNICSLYC